MNARLAFAFPGQGSQTVGMLADLHARHPVVAEVFATVSEELGRDLWALVSEGPAAALDQTENTQPAMLAAGVSAWRCWQARGGPLPALMCGHSLGEYSALVCAGALHLGDAARLVAARARLMQNAVPEGAGAMAAIIGLDDEQVARLCRDQAEDQVLEAVNFNAPGQVVIAGARDAVARAIGAAKAVGAKRALLLPVSVPSHCALMRSAADALAEALAACPMRDPCIPVLQNAGLDAATAPDAIRERLVRQLYSPVPWVGMVRELARRDMRLVIEAGPGKVLTGLNKRIDATLPTRCIHDTDSLLAALTEATHA